MRWFGQWNSRECSRFDEGHEWIRKHDLDTDEMCSEKTSDESKITPRLRAESVGVNIIIIIMYYYVLLLLLCISIIIKLYMKYRI